MQGRAQTSRLGSEFISVRIAHKSLKVYFQFINHPHLGGPEAGKNHSVTASESEEHAIYYNV